MSSVTGVVSVLLVTANGCSQSEGTSQTNKVQTYEVLEINPQQVTINTDYPATLQGQEVIEIRPRVEGYLEELFVDEGATVKKGQRLFRISSPQYEQELRSARAGIKTAQANVDAAQMTVNKTRPLVEKEIISEYELEAAEYTLASAKAELAQANATLANAEANLGFTIITSPADGVIGTLPYRRGSLVSSTSTDPLTTLSANKDMFAYFSLNEKQLLDFNRQFEGNTLQQKVSKLPAVELVLADGTVYDQTGTVQLASGIINTETGSASFRATFSNSGLLLQSGGSAMVRIPRSLDSALLVPQSATYEQQDKRLLYTVDDKNQVYSKAITTLATNDGQYFAVQTGLNKGEKIILSGFTGLRDSTTVDPKVVDPNTIYRSNKN